MNEATQQPEVVAEIEVKESGQWQLTENQFNSLMEQQTKTQDLLSQLLNQKAPVQPPAPTEAEAEAEAEIESEVLTVSAQAPAESGKRNKRNRKRKLKWNRQ